ncbi:MAG: SAF domain-containing protein [Bacilli bacterium]|nr:SAF domain-containing protein [Bacilli bacterium]
MNNLKASIKKFLGNKNTVTILGVIICLVILYIGYNYRINSQVELVQVPYAKETIQPRTYITEDMIGFMNVPKSFLVGNYYTNKSSIVGKYSNYNTVIAEGSIFYTDLVVSKDDLPDSAFQDVPEGYTVINYPVTISSTYANSMAPGSYINIYYKSLNDDGEVMFGKFISNVEVLDIKDSSGRHVFENSEETRTPAYMLFAVPEETHLLLRKALYLDEYDVELLLIPNTATLTQDDKVTVSSLQIEEFINSKTVFVSVDDLPNIEDQVTEETENNSENNNE